MTNREKKRQKLDAAKAKAARPKPEQVPGATVPALASSSTLPSTLISPHSALIASARPKGKKPWYRSYKNISLLLTAIAASAAVTASFIYWKTLGAIKDTANRQLRAYVSLEFPFNLVSNDKDPANFFATFEFKNFGQTPAHDMTYRARWISIPMPGPGEEYNLPDDFDYDLPLSMFGNGSIEQKRVKLYLVPTQAVKVSIHNSNSSVLLTEKGYMAKHLVFLYGDITYADVFDVLHRRSFCYWLTPDETGGLAPRITSAHNDEVDTGDGSAPQGYPLQQFLLPIAAILVAVYAAYTARRAFGLSRRDFFASRTIVLTSSIRPLFNESFLAKVTSEDPVVRREGHDQMNAGIKNGLLVFKPSMKPNTLMNVTFIWPPKITPHHVLGFGNISAGSTTASFVEKGFIKDGDFACPAMLFGSKLFDWLRLITPARNGTQFGTLNTAVFPMVVFVDLIAQGERFKESQVYEMEVVYQVGENGDVLIQQLSLSFLERTDPGEDPGAFLDRLMPNYGVRFLSAPVSVSQTSAPANSPAGTRGEIPSADFRG